MNIYNFKKRKILKLSGFLLLLVLMACVEPYEPKTETFEKTVVIEGMVTSEFKNQEIKISRTYQLEEDSINFVGNANVKVYASNGEAFNFYYWNKGIYRSEKAFKVKDGIGYQLEVEVDGKVYQSDEEMITGYSNMESVNVSKATNDDGQVGVAITVNSTAGSNESKYYRYTYEETYKIVSPYTSSKEFIVNESGLQLVDISPDVERTICYKTLKSKKGILSNTTYQTNNDQEDLLIKFMEIDDFKILYRYSILVKQHVISGEAFRFFETLDELSNSESVFAQNQPGFLPGNIVNINDSDENVVGYFEVASVEEKRIFFSFLDLFDYSERRDLREICPKSRPLPRDLVYYIEQGLLQYLSIAPPAESEFEGPYYLVPKECIDCRALGTNVQPEFWIEDE